MPRTHIWRHCLFQRSIGACHPVMHEIVSGNVGEYIESDPKLEPFFQRLRNAGKELFLVTNSPYAFV